MTGDGRRRLAGNGCRSSGLTVRGVMGYEGHLMMVVPESEKARLTEDAMALLLAAADDVGGAVISAGGTGTYAINTWATEIQAGSYALMDTAYATLGSRSSTRCACRPRSFR